MSDQRRPAIGFTCAYTPMPLIDAAGCTPYRVLPMGPAPDRAGQLLHDNLCPHVKRVLDRALSADLPQLDGMVFVNSCDAMRRLSDAWQAARTGDPVFLLDLPATSDDAAVTFFGHELKRLADWLAGIGPAGDVLAGLTASIGRFNRLCSALDGHRETLWRQGSSGGAARMQTLYNRASTQSFDESVRMTKADIATANPGDRHSPGVPVFLFGNVLPDPATFDLLAECGADIVGEDLCTGSRLFQPIAGNRKPPADALERLAAGILRRPPCARTFSAARPGRIADDTIAAARSSKARGAIGHTLKFCDPYLARLPMFREAFREAGIPLLLLEGDCSSTTMEQQRTRIEAFIEMLR